MKAWPFMFAASRTLDYQFVALPEIFDVNSAGSLRDCLEMDEVDAGRIRTASLSSSRGRALSCVYRSGPILVGDKDHIDSAGRKLLFASGLVVENLPEALDEPAHVIDDNSQWFERRLIAFLNSSENWTPVVTKSIKLEIDPPAQIPANIRIHATPVAVLSLISIVLFVLCVGLYVKNRTLESQLSESRPPTPKFVVGGDRKQSPDPVSTATPRVPEIELEKKSTVQPAPTPLPPSLVPEAESEKKGRLIDQPAPAPSPPSPVPEAEPEKKGPLIDQSAPAPSLPSPAPDAQPGRKERPAGQPAPARGSSSRASPNGPSEIGPLSIGRDQQ